jgi:signal transduction protein with GAF and PtsI domain
MTTELMPASEPGSVIRGRALSPGYAAGTAQIYHSRVDPEVPRYRIDPDAIALEQERLMHAVQRSIDELEQVRQRVLADIGEAEAEIIAAHRALIADAAFALKLRKRIERELVNAEFAIEREADDMAGLLASSVSAYLRERAQDVVDVKLRLLKHLGHGAASTLEQLPPGTIVVARELLPSDTLRLDRAHVTGLALEYGAPTSHAAILAGSMGIPAVGNIPGLLERVRDGVSLLVDGERGELVLDPDPSQVVSFGMARDSYDLATASVVGDEWKTCTTSDGLDITLLANIGRPAEVGQVRRHHLQGVGLFRTPLPAVRRTSRARAAARRLSRHPRGIDGRSGRRQNARSRRRQDTSLSHARATRHALERPGPQSLAGRAPVVSGAASGRPASGLGARGRCDLAAHGPLRRRFRARPGRDRRCRGKTRNPQAASGRDDRNTIGPVRARRDPSPR